MVTEHAILDFLRVIDPKTHAARFQYACIAHLTARFGIERRGVKHNNGALARLNCSNGRTLDIQGGDLTKPLQMFITIETRFGAGIYEVTRRLELTRRARLLALMVHSGFKSVMINLNIALTADVRSEIHRETISIVQREQGLTIQHAILGNGRQRGIKYLDAVLKRFAET